VYKRQVYVLVPDKKANWHYYGYSSDLKRRFAEHSSGTVSSTKPYLPLRLKYYEAYDTEAAAKRRETQLKSSRSATKTLHARIYGAD
jgi:putative endonuclease